MASQRANPNRSEAFGRLLSGAINSIATYEGKTAPIVEEEIGALAIVAGKTIQRYKAGHLPPEHRTIEILAEAAVQRGFLGREWLQRFLYSARYPFADKLLDRLCPAAPTRPRPPRVYHNLPAPTYSQFVMRAQSFAEVIEGLRQRSAVVLIVGLGGNGKTSLAREVAGACLKGISDTPAFDAVVWVSDKDRSGATNLSIVLDEIARTLDYPGFTQFARDEKLYEVGQLLKRHRVLIIIDNFETITDGALLTWLLRLPEPSKALVTSREYSRAFRNSTIVADLRGMSETEANEFITQRLHMLRVAQLVSNQSQLEPLVVATGGNPKAIEIALGLVKHERRPLKQVVGDLYAARGELFNDLFTRAWALLDEAARRVLLVMTFFPASASSEALSATADVHGFAFDRAIERLIDLALLDEQRIDLASTPRYTLHPLVRAFAGAKLKEQREFEKGARERWVEWYVQFVERIGVSSYNRDSFEKFEIEEESAFAVMAWAIEQNCFVPGLRLVLNTNYYYYIRGIWDKNTAANKMGAMAAHNLADLHIELRLLSYYVQRLIMQGKVDESLSYLQYIEELRQQCEPPEDILHVLQHTLALLALAQNRLIEAQEILEQNLQRATLLSQPTYQINTRIWLVDCLLKKEEFAKAQELAGLALVEANQNGYIRGSLAIQLRLAAIANEEKDLEAAIKWLDACYSVILQFGDRPNLARYQQIVARLHTLHGDFPAAHAALAEAIDLFERLGMRRELAEARAELIDLDKRAEASH